MLPIDQVHAPTTLGLEDGSHNNVPPTQGGPYAGFPPEGALHSTSSSNTHPSPWWGCSDASASRTGEAYVGGWCSASPNPTKDTVLWFHYAITADKHPWAFKDGNPQKRIAALELLGTLLLCKHLVTQQGQLPGRVRLPVGSDNSGNIFSLLNLSAKKPYSAALLMELVLFLHCEGCSIAPNHVLREYNTWADELTHTDFEGFSLVRRLPAPETLFVFPFATRLLSSTGFS